MSESKIKQDPKNARLHSEVNKEQINKSLKDLGAGRSVVIDNEDYLIAGNGVYEQAEKLGLKTKVIESDGTELVVIKRTDLNYEDEKRRKLAIADNATSESSDWNFEELTDDEIEEWSIEEHQEEEIHLEAKEDDFVEEVPEIPITVLGDLYEIGEHRLLCGDSTCSDAVAKLMNGELADICHTDPPYNIDYEGGSKKREKIANDKLEDFPKFLYNVYTTISTALKKGGAIYVWHASSETHNFIQQFLNAGFLFKSYIVWNKNNSTFGRSDYHWKHEPCIYGWLEGASHKWYGDRKQTTVWDIERPSRSDEHPTMKPIPLCSKPLENSSKQGDIVLDVFLGSGSTMVAAHQLERKCYGMELDPKYCDVIVKRMLNLDSKLTIKRNGIDCTEDFKTA